MSYLQSCKKHSGVRDVTDPLPFFHPTLPFHPAPRASRRMDVYPGVAKEAMIQVQRQQVHLALRIIQLIFSVETIFFS
jgi:hypothetical protein